MDEDNEQWWDEEDDQWSDETYYCALADYFRDRYNDLVHRFNLIDCE